MSESDAAEIANVSARLRQLVMQYEDTQETISELTDRVDELETELDSLTGVGEGEQSTPAKRALDLRQKLFNAAKARSGRDQIQWEWTEVRDQLEGDGHGTVHAPQAYRAMKEAAQGIEKIEDGAPDGFAVSENNDGNQVIRCSLPALSPESVNGINNAEADGHPRQTDQMEVNGSDPR